MCLNEAADRKHRCSLRVKCSGIYLAKKVTPLMKKQNWEE